MQFLIDFARVSLLAFGFVLIIGGGVVGLCGVIVFNAEIFLWGVALVVVGAGLYVPINRSFRDARARAVKHGNTEDET